MIAALPMYDFPQLRVSTDAFWAAIRDALAARGIEAPRQLTRGGDLISQWRDPTLLFSQTCGYPYWTQLRGKVKILATPVYEFDGCDGSNHCSFLVARRDDQREALGDFRASRVAINGLDSNTGFNLLRATIAPLGSAFFREAIFTGAHVASLAAVSQGQADLASIDCVTYGLLRPEGVKIVGRTASSPALPFITNHATPASLRAALYDALCEAMPQPALGLVSVAALTDDDYSRIGELAYQPGFRLTELA